MPLELTRQAVVTLALVVGLLGAFGYAFRLSYFGSTDIRNAFQYQSRVVAAQRDSELLEVEQFDRQLQPAQIRPYEKLLAGDLQHIDDAAETESELAPRFSFPASRQDYEVLTAALLAREALGRDRFESTVDRNRRTRDFSNAMFAFVALLFAVLVGRLRRRIEEGRSLVERLQRAFIAKRRELPNVDLGSVLLSATRGSNVGGDTFDAFTLDKVHGMFLVADVSGKGIDAAVDTALIKYTIRTLFSENPDPGTILTKFSSLYARSVEHRESFVVMFLAVLELETGFVRYASAGHEPAWAVVGQEVVALPPTGPIVGIEPESEFETRELQLRHGDSLVVTTDGLTESRDGLDRLLGAATVAVWVSELRGTAQVMADDIVRRLRRRSKRIGDDLAILVVKYAPRWRSGTSSAATALQTEPEPALASTDATR
jgi:serine phosphatase RsbU (regulator of sigma subunit)